MTEWRAVAADPRYEVSDGGDVRSTAQSKIPRLLHPTAASGGRYRQIWMGGRQVKVDALVLETFVGPRPPKMEPCHGDGDNLNDALTNLRWGTRAENIADQVKHGRHRNARKDHCDNGHEFTEENTIHRTRAEGGRDCRACKRERAA